MLPTGGGGGAFTRHFGIAFATTADLPRTSRPAHGLSLTSRRGAHGLSLTARGLSTSSTSSSGGMLLWSDVGVRKPLSSAAELSETTSSATGPPKCLAPIGVRDTPPP